MAIPGGFSYGDDLAAGKILANELKYKLLNEVKKFISDGKLIIGICNGFQILVKAGLLPGLDGFNQEATLMLNDSGKFEDRWTYLKSTDTKCVWTKDLPQVIYLPIAHGEGKFVTKDLAVLNKLKENKQVVFKYCDQDGKAGKYPVNPNGSTEDIAGICDETGRIFGLMPHPERHFLFQQHPHWTRLKSRAKFGDGAAIFKNGVEYAKKNL
jgi:phosphoribosylformylglycinamidine synthase